MKISKRKFKVTDSKFKWFSTKTYDRSYMTDYDTYTNERIYYLESLGSWVFEEQHCGRGEGCFWTDWEGSEISDITALRLVSRDRVARNRIGFTPLTTRRWIECQRKSVSHNKISEDIIQGVLDNVEEYLQYEDITFHDIKKILDEIRNIPSFQ